MKIWLAIFWANLAFFQKVAGPLLQRSLLKLKDVVVSFKINELPHPSTKFNDKCFLVHCIVLTFGVTQQYRIKNYR